LLVDTLYAQREFVDSEGGSRSVNGSVETDLSGNYTIVADLSMPEAE
jgi:hypothetical protein